MGTTLVNMRTYKGCDVIRIDRATRFGNPFRIGPDGSREQVIEKYKSYFFRRLCEDRFRRAVRALKGQKLGCWCTPLPCHGDVIIAYLESMGQ